jgi:hypothetical protein
MNQGTPKHKDDSITIIIIAQGSRSIVLFVSIISHQTAVLFSENKSPSGISHQPTEYVPLV